VGILLLKLFLAPLLVVTSTLVGRRWGPGIAGILVGQPVVAGPILFITYLQHGAGFASAAAGSSLLGLVSLAAFAVIFAQAARRVRWPVALAAGWTVVLALDAALSAAVRLSLAVSVAITLAATVAAMTLMPRAETEFGGRPTLLPPPSWDLPARAAATGLLVLAVTTASGALGPHWTGLLAPFPTALSVMAAFTHAQRGAAEAARTLAGAVLSLISFSVFCLAAALLVAPAGGTAFLLSAVTAAAVQLLVIRGKRALSARPR
jgi:hypothetical protein